MEQQVLVGTGQVHRIQLVIQDVCVCCGQPIPEGRMVCLNCERCGGRVGNRSRPDDLEWRKIFQYIEAFCRDVCTHVMKLGVMIYDSVHGYHMRRMIR